MKAIEILVKMYSDHALEQARSKHPGKRDYELRAYIPHYSFDERNLSSTITCCEALLKIKGIEFIKPKYESQFIFPGYYHNTEVPGNRADFIINYSGKQHHVRISRDRFGRPDFQKANEYYEKLIKDKLVIVADFEEFYNLISKLL